MRNTSLNRYFKQRISPYFHHTFSFIFLGEFGSQSGFFFCDEHITIWLLRINGLKSSLNENKLAS